MFKTRTLIIVLIAILMVASLGALTASAQEPDDTDTVPYGQQWGRGMMQGEGMQYGWRGGQGGMQFGRGVYRLHNPEECPIWQQNQTTP